MYERWRLPALKFITLFGKPLHGKSREQAIAEAVVNRFGCDRWCDALEREISLRTLIPSGPATNSKDSTDVPSSSIASETA
jgi:hypothetical protein